MTVKKVSKKSSPTKKPEEESPTKKSEEEDFSDLMKAELRMEDCMRFDQSKMENLQKL